MANGIAGLNPFPNFGGQQGSSGVTPVQIQPARVNFPTARTRAPTPERQELSTLEELTPALIGLLGITERATSGSASKPSEKEIIEYNKGIDNTSLTKTQKQAYKDAYRIYGKPRDLGTSGYDIARSVLPLLSGRTAPQAAKLASDITNTGDRIDATLEGRRQQFIKDRTKPPTFGQLTLIKEEDLVAGNIKKGSIVPGRFVQGIQGGFEQYFDRDKKQYVDNDGTYVEVPASFANSLKNLKFGDDESLANEFSVANKAIQDIDRNFLNQLTLYPDLVELLNKPITEVGTTFISGLKSKGNSLKTEFESAFAGKVFPNGTIVNGKEVGVKSEEYNKNTKQLVDDIEALRDSGLTGSELETAISSRMNEFIEIERTGEDQLTLEDNRTLQNFAKASANNIELSSVMIQLAYMAAGAAGQSGRTLSDKDLAFFLRIIGFESTSDPKVLLNNINRFFDRQLKSLDTGVSTKFNVEQFGVYGKVMENDRLAAGLTPYYSYEDVDGTFYDTWNDIPQDKKQYFANKGPSRNRTFAERYGKDNIFAEYMKLRDAPPPKTTQEKLLELSDEEKAAAVEQARKSLGLD
jgi:hypothetical protein